MMQEQDKDKQELNETLNSSIEILRTKLQSCDDDNIHVIIDQALSQNRIGVCEELLAFQVYDQLERIKNSKVVTEVELLDSQNTRTLYLNYLQKKKKSREQAKPKSIYCDNKVKKRQYWNDEEQKKRKRRKLLTIFGVIVSVLVVMGVAYKYRGAIVRILKMILNIK